MITYVVDIVQILNKIYFFNRIKALKINETTPTKRFHIIKRKDIKSAVTEK